MIPNIFSEPMKIPTQAEFLQNAHRKELDELKRSQKKNSNVNQFHSISLAFKAEEELVSNDRVHCMQHVLEAIKYDPCCIDAFRVSALMLKDRADTDTAILALREILSYSKIFLMEKLRNQKFGGCASCSDLLPYLRVLFNIADIARRNDRLDIAIYAYEELLRLDSTDHFEICHCLLACYCKIIARKIRGQHVDIVRTKDHLLELLKFTNGATKRPLFRPTPGHVFDNEEDIQTLARWSWIFISFIDHDEKWRVLAKREFDYDSWILDDMDLYVLTDGNKSNCLCHRCQIFELTKFAFIDSPHFITMMRRVCRNQTSIKFNALCRKKTPDVNREMTPKRRAEMVENANKFLDKGRNQLKGNNYEQSLVTFSQCKNWIISSLAAEARWYTKKEFFPMITNRASAAHRLKMWDLLRIDSRFALLMKPDHSKTYQKLQEISNALYAPGLKEDFMSIYEESQKAKTPEEFNTLAKKAIGLLSLSSFYYSRIGKLTDSRKKELEDVGIENMYTVINLPSYEHPMLPWLKEENLEKKVIF